MRIQLRLLQPDDMEVLQKVAAGVFDGPVDDRWAREFLLDPRHHMVVALKDELVVGMISGVDYVHPDKAPQLWINELGVADQWTRQGIGRRLMEAMIEHAREMGCTYAWVGTEEDNLAARALYEDAGGLAEPFILYGYDLLFRP